MPPSAHAEAEIGGRVQQELAYRFGGHPTLSKALSFLQLEAGERVGAFSRLTVIGRLFYDGALDARGAERLNPRLTPADDVSEHFFGAELKEAYLDFFTERADVRIGRQIVRWGLLEGARITDRINPLDFGEFLFRDVEDRYIPLWMVRTDYYPDWGEFQLLLIPDMTFHRPAPAGSEWEEFETPPGVREPATSVKNTEVGARIGWRVWETDINASYFYTWDDFPAAFRSVFGVGGSPVGVSLDARYERLHIFGLSLSKSVQKTVVSFEASYDHGKYLATDAGAMPGNEIKRDTVRWGTGLDLNLWGVDVSMFYFQEHVLHWEPFIPVSRQDEAASLMVREKFMNDRLEAHLLVLYFNTGHQYVARPGVSWQFTDRVGMTAGVDLLGGERGSNPGDVTGARDFRFVGYFREYDRAHMAVSYRF
ncbi:MAG: DUF1302 family protein [Leptospirillia bacterium]